MNNYLLGQILGYTTATINFILYIPQVIHVYKVRDTHSIDTSFILLQLLSCTSTLSYAVVINEKPLIVSSVSILISSGMIGYGMWILFKTPNLIGRHEYVPINPSNFQKVEERMKSNNINV